MGSKTIFVAVHGIGDQIRNETVQAVATRVFAHAGESPPLPLGAFHTEDQLKAVGAYFPPRQDPNHAELGFAEVHWADVTRDLATGGYTLEEAKAWAGTLVRRLKLSDQKKEVEKPEIDYVLLEMVLNEIIRTVAVSERLLSLARAANLGSFDLKRILDQFLGDVQFFTEFKEQREKILRGFSEVMQAVHDKDGDADIVVVAHSEGTVVAFMGLLEAASSDATPPWLAKVKALMTLGSPIDKHLVLWPEIWNDVSTPKCTLDRPIRWWNYYDNGDPVGFKLDSAREWLGEKGFIKPDKPLFAFEETQDLGFTRYPFPGKAHVDYWSDSKLFGHFLGREVKEVAPRRKGAKKSGVTPLRSNWLWVASSYCVPYLLAFAVLFLSVYALGKGAQQAGFVETILPWHLLGYATLLAGVTIAARIPRLVRKSWRWGVVVASFAGSAWAYDQLVEPKLLGPLANLGVALQDPFVAVGVIVVLGSLLISKLQPRWGMKPLVILGTVLACLLVSLAGGEPPIEEVNELGLSSRTSAADTPTRALWPMIVGGAFFLYLWWFAALLFDLVFVWHRYIRYAAH